MFFARFQFAISYRPGSRNTKADTLFCVHQSVDEGETAPTPILPSSATVVAIQCDLDTEIAEALKCTTVPPSCPIVWAHASPAAGHPGTYDVLDEEDVNDPLFKELHLVITGCHSSGKNDIGNAIFRKKVFTFFTSFKKRYVRRERTVFGTKVTLVRVPGWSGELNLHPKYRELRQEIKDAVSSFEKGLHAIILAIKVNNTLTKTTQTTLEKLLAERVWDHTIIIFTGGHKQVNIEDAISKMNIKPLIETCGKRYCVLQKSISFDESKKLIENIALMIAEKENVPLHFSVDEIEKNDESREKTKLLQRLKQKIQKLKRRKTNSRVERTESMMDISRLENIMRIHEGLQRKVLHSDQPDCETRNTEREENTMEAIAEIHHTEASALLGCTEMTSYNNPAQDAIELQDNFQCNSNVPTFDLHGWHDCLVDILDDLTVEQFTKMKNKVCNRKDRILRGHVENTDKDELARVMIQHWGEDNCIIYTRDILKDIPRNDRKIKNLIMPFLQKIGQSWS
ncbi:uncharacterized protein [Salminus brasiliensis]|uniref:uncharacterized protein n=1 Tax=Salminus brasiliensis TaxID=930266 RepID=UPI003B82FEC8